MMVIKDCWTKFSQSGVLHDDESPLGVFGNLGTSRSKHS